MRSEITRSLTTDRPKPFPVPRTDSIVRRATGLSALLAVALALTGCSGPGGGTIIEVVELDMHRPDGSTAAVTEPILEEGKTYRLTIEGTYSIWSGEWDSGTCAGIPGDAPMFPSAEGSNGKVGIDSEFYFAVPAGSALCSSEIPLGTGALEASLDGGLDFDDLDPISTPVSPDPDHSYEYEVTGQGHPIMFEREDFPSDDNYGVLKITVRGD
jgi:hypothetical protein